MGVLKEKYLNVYLFGCFVNIYNTPTAKYISCAAFIIKWKDTEKPHDVSKNLLETLQLSGRV